MSPTDIAQLVSIHTPITVDLETETISCKDFLIPFHIESYRRIALLDGLDEIAETLLYQDKIAQFEQRQQQQQPWLYSSG